MRNSEDALPGGTGTAPLIVHVVHQFGVGGLQNGIVNLINGMPADRWRHAVLALTDVTPEFARRIGRTDVSYIALGKRPGHLVREYPRLFRIFRKLRPAVVHTRNLAALEALVPAWLAGVKVRIHGEHGWDMQDHDGRSQRYRNVRRVYRPLVTRYVALSHHLEDYLERQVNVPATRISQIFNGVDTGRFHPAANGRTVIAGCPFGERDEWLVGTVVRMEAVKDPLNLAHAFIRANELSPAARNMRLVMVGEGSLRTEIAAVLAAAGLGQRVWFAGERADIPEILRGLDCFVLPSLAEGISNTILEAMASGLPIVATLVGGNSELIESGMTGALVPPANPDALAHAMLAYRTDRAQARRHAKAAQRLVQTRFSLTRMVSEYVNLYERSLASAGMLSVAAGDNRIDKPAGSLRTPIAPS